MADTPMDARPFIPATRSLKKLSDAVEEPRGKRRIHQTPRWSEVKACRPWLEEELTRVKPLQDAGCGFEAGAEGVKENRNVNGKS